MAGAGLGERSFDFAARLDGERLDIEHAGRSAAHRFLRVQEGSAGACGWPVLPAPTSGPASTAPATRWRVRDATGADAGSSLRAPMPGLVTAVPVAVGDRVRAGAPLVMLEAMKMLHTLSAPADGRVTELRCREGDAVRGGDLLVMLELETEDMP